MENNLWITDKRKVGVGAATCILLFLYSIASSLGYIKPVISPRPSFFWPLTSFIFFSLSGVFIYYFFCAEKIIEKIKAQNRNTASEIDPEAAKNDAMKRAIENAKKDDPLVGVKIAAKNLVNTLITSMKNDKGVHVESLITILGSLAGFSCQMSIREGLVKTGKISEDKAFVVIVCKDGSKYFAGDLLKEPLATAKLSVYSVAGGAVQSLGGKKFPDIKDISSHVASTIGGERFGIPRIPERHTASDLPINYVKAFWPKFLPMLEKECDSPIQWPTLFGLALQEVITMGKGTINPEVAFFIAMESAVPMSRIDPETI